MTTLDLAISTRVGEVFRTIKQFTPKERLVLAKLLLDTLLSNEAEDEADWLTLSLATFEQDWDNQDDAIYDNWKEIYGVQAR